MTPSHDNEHHDARRFRTNKRFAGNECGWCRGTLALGDALAVCRDCKTAHHAFCWDQKSACAAPAQSHDSGPVCRRCEQPLGPNAAVCVVCGTVTSPDGIYRGPTQMVPGAWAALFWGVLALLLPCGLVLGWLAVAKARDADRFEIDGRYHGHGVATAGRVLGIMAVVLWLVALATRLLEPSA